MPAPYPFLSRRPTSLSIEQKRLLHPHARYQHDNGLFSRQELARLRFLRWLYQTKTGKASR